MNHLFQTIKTWLGGNWAPVVAICTWVLLATQYISITPPGARVYDGLSHVEYTQIIAQQHRLPAPHEKWQTYHPPLYYLIDTLFAPESENHIYYIRELSLFYGTLFLLVLWLILRKVNKSEPLLQAIVLLITFITPSFFVVFTSYNNDSLATLLSGLIIYLSILFYKKPSIPCGIVLFIVSTAALYTKLTSLFAISTIILIIIIAFIFSKIDIKKSLTFVGIFIGSMFLFSPWLVFHNLPLSGSLLPNNFSGITGTNKLPENKFLSILRLPATSSREWEYPYMWSGNTDDVNVKKNVYSFMFDTSIFGAFVYSYKLDTLAWLIIWLSLIIGIFVVKGVFYGEDNIIAGGIVLGSVVMLALFTPYVGYISGADFRYVAWSWLGWGILLYNYLYSLSNEKLNPGKFKINKIAGIVLCSLCILLKFVFISKL